MHERDKLPERAAIDAFVSARAAKDASYRARLLGDPGPRRAELGYWGTGGGFGN